MSRESEARHTRNEVYAFILFKIAALINPPLRPLIRVLCKLKRRKESGRARGPAAGRERRKWANGAEDFGAGGDLGGVCQVGRSRGNIRHPG